MKKITTSNYQAYFLDYYEGTLNKDEEKELRDFLDHYPALKDELDSFEDIRLEPESISFTQKDNLKRQGSFSDDTIIAFMEGDLSRVETRRFKQEMASSAVLQQSLQQFRETKLIADTSIVFPDKQRLKRSGILRTLYLGTAIAASLTLFVAGYLMWKAPAESPVKNIALGPVFTTPAPSLQNPAEKPAHEYTHTVPTGSRSIATARTSHDFIAEGLSLPIHPQALPELKAEIAKADMPVRPVNQEVFIAREETYTSIPDLLKNKVKKKIRDLAGKAPVIARIAEVKDKSIWNYASAGITEIAKITGTNIGYEKSVDSTGTQYSRVVAGVFEYSSTSTSK